MGNEAKKEEGQLTQEVAANEELKKEYNQKLQVAASNIVSEQARQEAAYKELAAWQAKYKTSFVPWKLEKEGVVDKWGVDLQFLK